MDPTPQSLDLQSCCARVAIDAADPATMALPACELGGENTVCSCVPGCTPPGSDLLRGTGSSPPTDAGLEGSSV